MGWNIIHGPTVGHWVATHIDGSYRPGDVAIGLEHNGVVVAGVLYENWNGRSIVAHMAIEGGRVTPAYIAAIFDYAFNVCGVHKVILPVSSANAKSQKFVEHLGFDREAAIEDAAPDGDILLFTMTRDKCRFLGDRFNGKIRTSSARAA